MSAISEPNISPTRKPHYLPAALAGWLAYLVIDFLTHAVFLAAWWRSTAQYWLPPEDLFRAIPFGYASFALYCAVITWLLVRLFGQRASLVTGLQLGAIAGLINGVIVVLGVYSAFQMPASALLVWPLSNLVASTGAGAAIGWVVLAERPWQRVGLVLGIALFLFVVGVVLQNVFFPTPGVEVLQGG